MCHFLIFVPLVSLPLYSIFPWQEAAALYTLINGPLLVAGWLVRRAHRTPPVSAREGLIGRKAAALTDLAPERRVRCGNELWMARSSDPVSAGEEVREERVQNIILLVRPLEKQKSMPTANNACFGRDS